MLPLPVDSLLPELIERLQHNSSVIVQAPPGSGKTTRIAPALIDAGLCDHENRTFLLQPRRVAAKATAQRISDERGVRLGQQVGYQVRFENKVSDKSALIVATEGILLRKLSVDPTLDGIGTVILDEFHERSLNADLILAMLRQIQQVVRDDLRLIVMSATLDIEPLKRFLDAPVLHSAGTLHPVEIKYRQPRARQKLTEHVAETVALTAQATEGDMLVFLPGVGEISQTETLLKREPVPGCQVLPLHGSMPLEKQSQVLRSNGEGSAAKRRIILSTNVAETSLTIEGIRTVVDSGQARVLRFSPSVGLDRLLLEPICQSSATQRAGRAGRLDSGLCVRLWDEKTQRSRPEFLEPEVRRVDLTSAVLQLYQWGERPEDFPWLEPPSEESVTTAIELLEQLGAVRDRRITELGQQMCALPTSPRLARMLISLKEDAKTKSSQIETLSLVAAMISERDPFIRQHGNADRHSLQRHWNCDVTQRLLALQAYYDTGDSQTSLGEVHRGAARNIRMVAKQFASIVQDDLRDESSSFERDTADDSSDEFVAKSLLLAFPDRLARRRKAGEAKGRMTGGRGVRLAHESGVHSPELFLCIDVDDRATEAIVRQASGIHADWLPADLIDEREELFFNPIRKQVEARRRVYFGDLMLSEQTATITKRDECEKLLYAQACQNLESIVPESSSKFQSWWTRMACLAQWSPELELPNCDDLLLKDLLIDLCPQKRSFAELKSAPWLDWLKSRLTPEQVQAIDRECPEKLEVPSGSRIKLEYEPGKPPVLAVRIQEVFSWRSTPRIAHGRVPVLLHLLAPNYRPQQITDDLASFWENTYDLVRKELMRRYPKHAWPDDPINAKPECKGGQRRS